MCLAGSGSPSTTRLRLPAGSVSTSVFPPPRVRRLIIDRGIETELPKKPIDPYEPCEPDFKAFVLKRLPFFLFTQVIDRGQDKDVSLDIKHVKDIESAVKI